MRSIMTRAALSGCLTAAALVALTPATAHAAEQTWVLKVATGKSFGAGTDATIQAQLNCQNGKIQSSMQTLDKPNYNDFERASEAEYTISVPQDCTKPTSVSFQMVGGSEFDGAAWQFRKVAVWKQAPEGQRTYYYGGEGSHGEAGGWIDADTIHGHRFISTPLRTTF